MLDSHLPDGLIAPHFEVVNHLVRVEDGPTPLALASAFQVPKTSMTHTLAGLAEHKLISMRANPDDKRSKKIWLTAKGRSFHKKAIASMAPDVMKMTTVISPKQVGTVLPVLRQLREFLDNSRDR